MAHPYCSGTELDGFEGVFDLKETAFRGKGATIRSAKRPRGSLESKAHFMPRSVYLISGIASGSERGRGAHHILTVQ